MQTFIFIITLAAVVLGQPTPSSSATPSPSVVVNTTQEYNLKTCLKPGQPEKTRFDNLWLYAYHTGAGLNDVTFDGDRDGYAIKGFLNDTQQVFDLGNSFPYSLKMDENVNFYAGWEPARIDAGEGGQSGFFFNDTGLQFDSSASGSSTANYTYFAGWLVCEWWHTLSGVPTPQLFFRITGYDTTATPAGCADVYLIPEYF